MELDVAAPPAEAGPDELASIPLPPGGRLRIAWGAGNELLCAGLPVAAPYADMEDQHDAAATAAAVQWGCPSPAERRIAYDTLPKFKQLQLALRQGEPGARGAQDARGAVLDFSRAVSDILATEDPGDEAAAELSRERALWELLELFFAAQPTAQGTATEGLARWLARNQAAQSPAPLAPRLATAAEALPAEQAKGFWGTVARAAALGWTQEAVTALASHSAMLRWADEAGRASVQAEVDVLEPVLLLLRRMPRYCRPADRRGSAGRDFDDFAEFQHYRTAWQTQCRDFLAAAPEWAAARAAAPATADGAHQVLSVLAGVESALVAAATSWPELLVAQLLHVYPGLRPQGLRRPLAKWSRLLVAQLLHAYLGLRPQVPALFENLASFAPLQRAPALLFVELRALVRRCIGLARGAGGSAGAEKPPPLDALPEILQAAAEGDAQSVVAAASGAGCGAWFLAHAPLLLAASPRGAAVMAAPLPHAGGDQAEAYLLEYAASLAPHRATRRLAAEYFAWCPVHGAAAFAELLPRLQPGTALHLAKQQQLPDLTIGIRRAEAAQHLRAGRLGSALAELAAAGDSDGAASALALLLADVAAALTSAPQPSLQQLPDLGQLAWLLGALDGAASAAGGGGGGGGVAFLRTYARLTAAWAALQTAEDQQGVREEAAAAAVAALAAAPAQLWLPLAAAVVPLLEASPPALSLADTQQLLLRLQQVSGKQYTLELPPGLGRLQTQDTGVAAEQAATVSRALARGFARSHIAEMHA